MNPLTSFQRQAKNELETFAHSRGLHFDWSEQPGPLYDGEVMLVACTKNASLTVWVYEDALDYRLQQSEVVNFEAESFVEQKDLLSAALAHLRAYT